MAALVRSLMSFCLFKFAFDERFRWIFFPILDLYLWRLLPRLAFMVTARVALKGLWACGLHLLCGDHEASGFFRVAGSGGVTG